jgi:hypothetical protein
MSQRDLTADIVLEGDSILVTGSGAVVNGTTVTITAAGTFQLSGSLDDGQVIVDTADQDSVVLLLNGVDIQSAIGSAIYVRNAEKTVITLVAGTENQVSDPATYTMDALDSEADGAIFSHDDLTINGSGSLAVYGNYNHGIVSQDDLKITGGNIRIESVNDGLRGRDSISILDGLIQIQAGGDGMQSNNDEDAERGNILIEGGTIEITAALDGIQAESRLTISAGDLTVTAGGGAPASIASEQGWPNGSAANESTISTKGLKAGVDVTITGGTIEVNSLDDAVHSNDSMTINGGTLNVATGDDGFHADTTLTILSGDVTVTRSYEGIESAAIEIQGGDIHVTASDDGVNGSDGTGGGMGGGQPGLGGFETGGASLTISGGYLVVDALGDGLDVNGPITMSDGVVLVVGPVSNGNGALDYLGEFNISGGLLVAVGSSGMAEAPSQSSSQLVYMHNFTSTQPAGTLIRLTTNAGQDVLTFEPWREFSSVVISSPDLQSGESYTLYTGGESTGSNQDGLYSGGESTAGFSIISFTISSVVTMTGSAAGGFGGGPGGGGRGGAPPNRP